MIFHLARSNAAVKGRAPSGIRNVNSRNFYRVKRTVRSKNELSSPSVSWPIQEATIRWIERILHSALSLRGFVTAGEPASLPITREMS